MLKSCTKRSTADSRLKGKTSLEERFADIDIVQVCLKLNEEAEQLRKYPRGMDVIFEIPNLPEELKITDEI